MKNQTSHRGLSFKISILTLFLFISSMIPLYSATLEQATHEVDRMGREEESRIEKMIRSMPKKPKIEQEKGLTQEEIEEEVSAKEKGEAKEKQGEEEIVNLDNVDER